MTEVQEVVDRLRRYPSIGHGDVQRAINLILRLEYERDKEAHKAFELGLDCEALMSALVERDEP